MKTAFKAFMIILLIQVSAIFVAVQQKKNWQRRKLRLIILMKILFLQIEKKLSHMTLIEEYRQKFVLGLYIELLVIVQTVLK